MAAPTLFFRALCLVICVSLAWFSVVAKPIELPALSQRQWTGNLSYVGGSVEGVDIEGTHSVDHQVPTAVPIGTPSFIDQNHCALGCAVTFAEFRAPTLTCSSPFHCSLDSERIGATYSCYRKGGETAIFDAITAATTATSFLTADIHDYPPGAPEPTPVGTKPPAKNPKVKVFTPVHVFTTPTLTPAQSLGGTSQITSTVTKYRNHGPDEPEEPVFTPLPGDAPPSVPGQQTVYVTVTEESATGFPLPTKAYSSNPLSEGPPESNKLAIILGSVFGTVTIVCILSVFLNHFRKLRRQECEETQENQEKKNDQDTQEQQEDQEHHGSVSSAEDTSELLRQQQQTYGYYGTQRVASSCIVPQQMKVFSVSPEPVELLTPEDKTAEKEQREGH